MLDDNDIYLEQDFEVQFIIDECVVPDNLGDEADYTFHVLVDISNDEQSYMTCICKTSVLRQAKLQEVPGDIARAIIDGVISTDRSTLYGQSIRDIMTLELEPTSPPQPEPELLAVNNHLKRTLEEALEKSDQTSAREFKKLKQSICEARRTMSDMYFEDYRPNPKDLLDDYMDDTMDVDDTEEVLHELKNLE